MEGMLSYDISDMCDEEIPRELAVEFYKYGAAELLDKDQFADLFCEKGAESEEERAYVMQHIDIMFEAADVHGDGLIDVNDFITFNS
jgi:hypothetical protein